MEDTLDVLELPIERIQQHHDTDSFSSENEELNSWLSEYALDNDRGRVGTTYVAADGDEVLGFYTYCPTSVTRDRLPNDREFSWLPYEIPAYLLGRLGVDEEFQNQGLGQRLVADALTRIQSASEETSGRFVIVDAKDEELAEWYEEKIGFRPMPSDPETLFITISEIEEAANR